MSRMQRPAIDMFDWDRLHAVSIKSRDTKNGYQAANALCEQIKKDVKNIYDFTGRDAPWGKPPRRVDPIPRPESRDLIIAIPDALNPSQLGQVLRAIKGLSRKAGSERGELIIKVVEVP